MRFSALIVLAAAACSGSVDTNAGGTSAGALTDEDRRTMGSFFLVEQPDTVSIPETHTWMASAPPGGLCFWNTSHVSGTAARDVILAYSREAQSASSPPVLFSVDYEGGGTPMSPTGKLVAGIQRYVTDMTPLAHGRWLGTAYTSDPALGHELAHLHGYLMARELRSIGINYPLGTVSDLAHNLFVTRGISPTADDVASLIGEVVSGALSVDHMMFVTKHFPGLGLTTGDTHDGLVVAPMYDDATAQSVLEPFQAAMDTAVRIGADARFSMLAGHAQFPYWDATLPTTVSPKILGDLLRTQLRLPGVVVSDAMWMGTYGTMSTAEVVRVYVQSFLAGMDLLMIPHYKYDAAVAYFRALGDGTQSSAEQDMLGAALGMSYDDARAKFLVRMTESRARLDAARDAVGYAHENADPAGSVPTSFTTVENARYNAILKQLDARMP
jgi:beta-glucosidase-like glycosyl hydrolase